MREMNHDHGVEFVCMGDTLVRTNWVDDLICFLLCGLLFATDDFETEVETDRQTERDMPMKVLGITFRAGLRDVIWQCDVCHRDATI